MSQHRRLEPVDKIFKTYNDFIDYFKINKIEKGFRFLLPYSFPYYLFEKIDDFLNDKIELQEGDVVLCKDDNTLYIFANGKWEIAKTTLNKESHQGQSSHFVIDRSGQVSQTLSDLPNFNRLPDVNRVIEGSIVCIPGDIEIGSRILSLTSPGIIEIIGTSTNTLTVPTWKLCGCNNGDFVRCKSDGKDYLFIDGKWYAMETGTNKLELNNHFKYNRRIPDIDVIFEDSTSLDITKKVGFRFINRDFKNGRVQEVTKIDYEYRVCIEYVPAENDIIRCKADNHDYIWKGGKWNDVTHIIWNHDKTKTISKDEARTLHDEKDVWVMQTEPNEDGSIDTYKWGESEGDFVDKKVCDELAKEILNGPHVGDRYIPKDETGNWKVIDMNKNMNPIFVVEMFKDYKISIEVKDNDIIIHYIKGDETSQFKITHEMILEFLKWLQMKEINSNLKW